MRSIETKLHMEIEAELDRLDRIENKSGDEFKTVSDNVAKLIDRAIEMEKLGNEVEKFQLQMREEQKDRLIKNCIAVASIIVPVGLTVWGTIVSMKFEETGTITTAIGRGFISRLLPKK